MNSVALKLETFNCKESSNITRTQHIKYIYYITNLLISKNFITNYINKKSTNFNKEAIHIR